MRSGQIFVVLPDWWNRQTRWIQNPLPLKGVPVRLRDPVFVTDKERCKSDEFFHRFFC